MEHEGDHEAQASRVGMAGSAPRASVPLFPLGSALFPGMLLPLHIFEPRYRLLVKRSIEKDEPFGIVLIKSGPEVGGPAEPHRVGTTAKIMASTPLPRPPSSTLAPPFRPSRTTPFAPHPH